MNRLVSGKKWLAVVWLLLALVSSSVLACKIPVFRYALERWEADPYRLVVLYQGSRDQAVVDALVPERQTAWRGKANLEWDLVDIEALTEEQLWQYEGLEELGDSPSVRLYFPHGTKIEEPIWSGPLGDEALTALVTSDVRSALVDEILAGVSAVWVLLESGDEVADDEAAQRLAGYLDEAAAALSIPEGVVRAEDVGPGGTTPDGKPLEMDDVLRTSIPLRIGFSVRRMDPKHPDEAVFAATLKHLLTASGVPARKGEPIAFPVFGRGRVLEGIAASLMTAGSIKAACAYLCGECSCQVKDQNPGVDLLLHADWAGRLKGNALIVERPLPALSGFGVGDSSNTASPLSPDIDVQARVSSTGQPKARSLGGIVLASLGILLVTVLVGTVLMGRSSSD